MSFEQAAAIIGIDDDLEDRFDARGVKKPDKPKPKQLVGRRVTIVIERIDYGDDAMSPTVQLALTGYLLGLMEESAGKGAEEHFRVNATTKMVVNGISFEVETTHADHQALAGGDVVVR